MAEVTATRSYLTQLLNMHLITMIMCDGNPFDSASAGCVIIRS